ncbi:hypothetical protein PVAP13_7KG416100 [Panicum virgatum]|uniref:Uncharacterized protein n=1 Tax=Panicum virgatum TaxID=38727 RepID=A0A8T0QQN7_PANVG|nr:hypothetical protein PVAP13_7KG416100 [Panicum virgatum]
MAAAAADASAVAAAIARRLGSCNAGARERTVRYLLSNFLPVSAPRLSTADLLKLWKGLFFFFWHADKPLYQSSVATRLASAVSAAPSPADGAAFLAAYLTTLRREWAHIDVHRLDKFYLLNRRFLHHAFLLLISNSFAPDVTSGLGYHVAEAFLDELLPVLPVSLQTMDALLAPFFTVLEKSSDRVMIGKVKEGIFDRFLVNGNQLLEKVKKGEEVEKDSAEEKLGKVGLLFGFSKRFLDIGAKTETVQSNRKVVFGLRDAFVKVEKGLELSGVEIPVPKFEATEVQVVPDADNSMELGAKALKREKKVKKEKKEKKKKADVVEGGDAADQNTDAQVEDQQMGDGTDGIKLDGTFLSNLQKQFEKAAAEDGMVDGGGSSRASTATPVNGKVAKKRKRLKSVDRLSEASDGDDGREGNLLTLDGEKSGKKVRFSMKNNIGVQPGPIKETPTPLKKAKPKAKSAKKVLNKKPSSVVKRLRKLQSFSA